MREFFSIFNKSQHPVIIILDDGCSVDVLPHCTVIIESYKVNVCQLYDLARQNLITFTKLVSKHDISNTCCSGSGIQGETGMQGVTGLPGGGTGIQGVTGVGVQGVTGLPGGGTGIQIPLWEILLLG